MKCRNVVGKGRKMLVSFNIIVRRREYECRGLSCRFVIDDKFCYFIIVFNFINRRLWLLK